jgi:hypothetical protein
LRTPPKVACVVASFLGFALAAPRAFAAPMDPTPERLILQPVTPFPGTTPMGLDNCQTLQLPGNPQAFYAKTGLTTNNFACRPNNTAWANMMSELAYAIAPSAFHPARTTGFGGFALSFEASFAHVNADARDATTGVQYWHYGTQGGIDPSTHQFSTIDNAPDSILQIYTLKARKGLGFGFEATGALGYVANTSLWVGGADLHWAVLEGYRTGFLGYVPDVAVGGGVRTLGGSPKFFLTTVGIDAQVSKPIPLADSAVLTPYVGGQRLFIFADSTVVSLTPNVDPLQQCGYMGADVPRNPAANPMNDPNRPYDPNHAYSGQPVCANQYVDGNGRPTGQPINGDFNNQVTFSRVRAQRWRGIAGLTYRYEVLWLAGQFATDLEDPGAENNSSSGISGSKQWTVSVEAGVFF